ncbi:MAG: hypothetical protein JO113_08810, partial [Candidatus Eremiobacteraeota bacterium]|nr:hypothetical protein [Candidatus Eremiobacteraeota bacterium]
MLAFAISIALHEVVAGIVPHQLGNNPSQQESISNVRVLTVALRQTPRPAPVRTTAPEPIPTPHAAVTLRPIVKPPL